LGRNEEGRMKKGSLPESFDIRQAKVFSVVGKMN
jgi:hypothetical protein